MLKKNGNKDRRAWDNSTFIKNSKQLLNRKKRFRYQCNLHYISLKDIMCNTSTRCLLYEGNVFDSDIAIRNELVKRAASVYLQSALVFCLFFSFLITLGGFIHCHEIWWGNALFDHTIISRARPFEV